MKKLKKIKHLATLSRAENGITKELNLVELNGNPYYHAGAWMNGKSIEGIFLKEGEAGALVKTLSENDNEIKKFQKDYIQQSHNGNVEREDMEW